ncbi:MAG: type II secretion system GspH family protein, partial [Fusobacterium sp.]|nr:type II secretion system GspH family protein [Fusobacterium sp.]
VLTWTGGGGPLSSGKSNVTDSRPAKYGTGSAGGFTMAEILLSLTIIGVVAAITLPSLTGNINERTWNTQRKALFARFSQAIALMPALNGYGTLSGTIDASGSQAITEDNVAETFITAGLSKVLKMNNVCDNDHLEDCGVPASIITLRTGTKIAMPKSILELNSIFNMTRTDGTHTWTYRQLDTKAAAFETANGESVVTYYNPYCKDLSSHLLAQQGAGGGSLWVYMQPAMCANFIYDLNGTKGPNTVGKDIGVISVLYPTDSLVVAPVPLVAISNETTTYNEANGFCGSLDSDSRMPNLYELSSMFYNMRLFDLSNSVLLSSTTIYQHDGIEVWRLHLGLGYAQAYYKNSGGNVRCVKR